MNDRIRALANGVSSTRMLRFGLVGSVGFAIDALALGVLYHGLGAHALVARAFSFPAAVVATWLLNRKYTFANGGCAPLRLEFLRYIMVNGVGLAINVGVYAVGVSASSFMSRHPVLALAIAAALAALANYAGSARFVFTLRQD